MNSSAEPKRGTLVLKQLVFSFLGVFCRRKSRAGQTCRTGWHSLDFGTLSFKASLSVNFERFTVGRLFQNPVNVKLCESPGRAGGLPWGNYGSK